MVATNLAYPLVDVAQLVLITGMLAATQWRVAPAPLSMSLGIVAMAVVDCVFLYLAAAGLFRPGTVLTPLSLGGTALVALAAWLSERGRRRPPLEGPVGLVVPVLLTVALWLLARTHVPQTSRTLVLDAVLGGLTAAALA